MLTSKININDAAGGINPRQLHGLESELAQRQAADGLSFYLHIPFCKTRCTYCDFNTYTNLGHLQGRYAIALAQEVERSLAAVAAGVYQPLAPLPTLQELGNTASTGPVRTIFFGGGTPSLLPPSFLGKTLEAIARRADLRPGTEITVEANPGTLSLEKLRGLRQIGVNRLSFGVQTFDDPLLKSLGRTHTGAEAVEALEMARRAGFDNVNLDFIYGLPGQNMATWQSTLERAISIRPAHLSVYGLTVEEGTMLHRQVESGKLTAADSDTAADMYEMAQDLLEKAGYAQYEISNWALRSPDDLPNASPRLACQHNLVYWRNLPYLGSGPGAHSSFAGWRFPVMKDPEDYIRRLRANQSVIVADEAETITRGVDLADSIILALRLNEGLELAKVEREFGYSLEELFPGTLGMLTQAGLVEHFEGPQLEKRIRLTRHGRLVSNEVFLRFLPD
ncbi:MAG: Oxygen-independent coproporphyrinogen-III oxidase-like protein [Chloroflexi bacterium]|jgi:oxygen-independent coproporphyrinogen-3 oxidase|nr:Oxygen-independent coproporphyrinogen-III oxidase-like protein [Chloroflexota bacterium]